MWRGKNRKWGNWKEVRKSLYFVFVLCRGETKTIREVGSWNKRVHNNKNVAWYFWNFWRGCSCLWWSFSSSNTCTNFISQYVSLDFPLASRIRNLFNTNKVNIRSSTKQPVLETTTSFDSTTSSIVMNNTSTSSNNISSNSSSISGWGFNPNNNGMSSDDAH